MKSKLDTNVLSGNRENKTFRCEVCGKIFTREKTMAEHINSIHEGKKPFKCDICDHSFSRKDKMKLHVTSVHIGIQPVH